MAGHTSETRVGLDGPGNTQFRSWRDRIAGVIRLALPQTCALCAAQAGTRLLCAPCIASLPILGTACPCCALPSVTGDLCCACNADRPPFDATTATYVYAFPLDRLVQALKYNGALSFAGWFARAMLEDRGSEPRADVMVTMPLSPKRQRERGFNHALEIARPLSRWTGIRLDAGAVIRIRETATQATLPWSERSHNVLGAFACSTAVIGKSVMVIDDVMTTGASLAELALTSSARGR